MTYIMQCDTETNSTLAIATIINLRVYLLNISGQWIFFKQADFLLALLCAVVVFIVFLCRVFLSI